MGIFKYSSSVMELNNEDLKKLTSKIKANTYSISSSNEILNENLIKIKNGFLYLENNLESITSAIDSHIKDITGYENLGTTSSDISNYVTKLKTTYANVTDNKPSISYTIPTKDLFNVSSITSSNISYSAQGVTSAVSTAAVDSNNTIKTNTNVNSKTTNVDKVENTSENLNVTSEGSVSNQTVEKVTNTNENLNIDNESKVSTITDNNVTVISNDEYNAFVIKCQNNNLLPTMVSKLSDNCEKMNIKLDFYINNTTDGVQNLFKDNEIIFNLNKNSIYTDEACIAPFVSLVSNSLCKTTVFTDSIYSENNDCIETMLNSVEEVKSQNISSYLEMQVDTAKTYANNIASASATSGTDEYTKLYNEAYQKYISENGLDALQTLYSHTFTNASNDIVFSDSYNFNDIYANITKDEEIYSINKEHFNTCFTAFATIQTVGSDELKTLLKNNLNSDYYNLLEKAFKQSLENESSSGALLKNYLNQ